MKGVGFGFYGPGLGFRGWVIVIVPAPADNFSVPECSFYTCSVAWLHIFLVLAFFLHSANISCNSID